MTEGDIKLGPGYDPTAVLMQELLVEHSKTSSSAWRKAREKISSGSTSMNDPKAELRQLSTPDA